MIKIDHVVFDIGRVLLHWDPEIPFKRLIPNPEERHWFFENICTSEWNIEQDRGRPWHKAEDMLIAQHPDQEDNIRAYRKYWHEMVPYHHTVTADLLRKMVTDGKDVTLLTNFATDTFEMVHKRFDFLGITRGVTVSGEIGLIKPDPAIFAHHQSTFGLDPSVTLFLDDSAANVKAAIKHGWHAIQVINPANVPRQLKGYRI